MMTSRPANLREVLDLAAQITAAEKNLAELRSSLYNVVPTTDKRGYLRDASRHLYNLSLISSMDYDRLRQVIDNWPQPK